MRSAWAGGLILITIGLGGFAVAESPLTDPQIAL
jgi:hypothetical protein